MVVNMADLNILRINELSKKSKTEQGLTDAEKQEQVSLRTAYVKAMRGSLENQLKKVVIVDDDGKQTPLQKK